jgi:ribosomal protein L37AE/L43A
MTPCCPHCGASGVKRIIYGLPTEEVARDPDVEVAGCVIEPGAPAWRCRACGEGFGGVDQVKE